MEVYNLSAEIKGLRIVSSEKLFSKWLEGASWKEPTSQKASVFRPAFCIKSVQKQDFIEISGGQYYKEGRVLEKHVERRRCRRFEIPNAKVRYKKTGLFGFFSRFSPECPMLNMSKGGLAFLSETTFRFKQIILVQLLLPNMSPLVLIGRVIWQTDRNFVNEAMTGIEFVPFGSRRGFNPIEALRVLQRIDSQYGEASGDK